MREVLRRRYESAPIADTFLFFYKMVRQLKAGPFYKNVGYNTITGYTALVQDHQVFVIEMHQPPYW